MNIQPTIMQQVHKGGVIFLLDYAPWRKGSINIICCGPIRHEIPLPYMALCMQTRKRLTHQLFNMHESCAAKTCLPKLHHRFHQALYIYFV